MRNKPRIRFKGFTEDWEQRKLLTVLNKIVDYRGRTPKKLGLDWSSTGHLALSALNVKMGYIDKTVDAHYGDDHLYSVWMKDNDLYEGQVLFTTEAPMGNVAQVPDDNKYILSQRTIAFVPDRSVISDNFLAVVLSASKCQKSLTNRASGGTAKGVSQKTLSEISLDIPQSLSEQDKVSELIKKLSNVITLHQHKLEKLKLAKKALLQKLFPKNGSQFPKIRFKGFTDAWEQRKLGDIATITGGGTPSTNISEYWNGDIDWYSPVEIGEKRYASGSIRKITKLGLEKSSAKILPVGTVLFTSRAGIGNTAILQVEGCTNQGFQSITPNSKELDTYFLYTMTPKLKRYGEVTGAGSTFVEVSGKQMEQMNLMIPSLDEQKHVSQLFKVMDDAITLHQCKLDKLQDVKKGLLQKMFV